MAQISGKYELVHSENFAEYLTSFGNEITKEFIKTIAGSKSALTVKVEEDKYTITSETGSNTRKTSFASGDKFDEEAFKGKKFTCLATVTGNQIKISSTSSSGETADRIYDFDENGVAVTYSTSVSDIVAKRVYNRV